MSDRVSTEKDQYLFRCGEPPKPGTPVYRGDALGIIGSDGSWHALTVADQGLPLRDRIVDRLFCPACLRLRVSPGHLMFCRTPRVSSPPGNTVQS